VLVEFLASFSKRTQLREAAVEYVELVRRVMEVVPSSTALFLAGLDLYRRRPDKTYSMVDCMSMVLCRQRAIDDVLTADRDFEQEGFTLLLR
jgi:predicted nucleic acid-binding protein